MLTCSFPCNQVAITSLLREATESREGMVPNQGKEEDPDFEVADEDPNEQPCYEPAPFVEPDTYILLKVRVKWSQLMLVRSFAKHRTCTLSCRVVVSNTC